jgi:multiple sugar transport system ATP-binding protein
MNFLPAKVVTESASLFVELKDGSRLLVPEAKRSIFASAAGRKVTFGIRPEAISGRRTGAGWAPLEARVELVEPLGSTNMVYFNIAGDTCCASLDSETSVSVGAVLPTSINMNQMHMFDNTDERSIAYDKIRRPSS